MTSFRSDIFILPGLGDSLEGHWQTLWQKRFDFKRIQQKSWDQPVCEDWINTIQKSISVCGPQNVILVGHSLACSTIVFWSEKFNVKIKGALLVAPSDTESEVYPEGTTGFKPMPLTRLPFPSIAVSSDDDIYVSESRARHFAKAWGSELVMLSKAGHINVASGHGAWPEGIELLKRLD